LSERTAKQLDSFSLALIPGATESELRVNIQGKYNAGHYHCRVQAAQGEEVLTRLARLTVTGDRRTYKGQFNLIGFV
jgi:hypothetical protein